MAKRIVTLDIDSGSLRLLEVEGRRVVRWGSARVEPGVVKDGVVAAPEALGALIRGLMRATGIAAAPVVASVAGIYSMTRILSVPPPAAVQAVLAEARQVLPVPLEELYVSWRPLSANEEGQQYLLVGVPREVVDSRLLALRAARLRPRALEPKTLALALLAGRPDALIINAEPASLDVVLLTGGLPGVFHSVAVAEEGLSTEERAEVTARDLRLAVDFCRSRYPLRSLPADAPLLLAGSLSADAGFATALVNAVDHPVATLEPPLEYPGHLPVAQYAVNLGLALSRVRPQSAPGGGAVASLPVINLLPRRRRLWNISPRQAAMALAFVAALVGLVGLYQAASSALGETRLLRQQMDLVDLRLEQIRQENAARRQLEKQLEEYRGLISGRAVVTGYIRLVEESKPPGVELLSIAFGEKGIDLQASADTWEQAEAYTEALRETGHFASVLLPSEGSGGEEAEVSFTLKPEFPKEGPRLIE